MKLPLSGQCICGAIAYHCESEPKFTLMCQCRQCQRITGTGHSAQFAVAAEKTSLSGSLQTYTLTSNQGNEVVSAFCGTCGNPIYKKTSMMPDMLLFHAATLDDPGQFKPQMVVYTDTAQPWDHIDPAIERKQ